MKIFRNKNNLIKEISILKNLGFVPTMGTLHSGHISLIRKAKKESKRVLVSIFINSKQFKTITLVGYDFYTSNDKTLDINKKSSNYYFLHDDNIKNIRDNTIGNTHNPQQSIDYIIKRIKEHPDIQFIMYTNCTLFPTLSNLEIR